MNNRMPTASDLIEINAAIHKVYSKEQDIISGKADAIISGELNGEIPTLQEMVMNISKNSHDGIEQSPMPRYLLDERIEEIVESQQANEESIHQKRNYKTENSNIRGVSNLESEVNLFNEMSDLKKSGGHRRCR